MSEQQKNLLGQLSIDRDARSAGSARVSRLALGVLIGLLLALGTAWFLYPRGGGEPGPVPAPAAAPVAPAVASSAGDVESVLSASGYITARRMATVASRITGLITEVVVEEGMQVGSGAVLARLDDALARVDMQLAEAQLRAANSAIDRVRASLAEAERVLARVTRLKTTDFSSEAALTEARASVERLNADLAVARADAEVAHQQVARQRENLDQHVIRAPFAGVVTDKNAQPGEVVSPMSAGGGFTRTGICTIVDMASLEIEVDVNEAFIGRVSEGQEVTANLDAYPEWDIPARVVAIIPTANRERATVRVRIGLEASDPRILPDMGVKVAFMRTARDKGG